MPTYAEKRHLPHTCEQMFNLVADVEMYPEFLPWCIGTRITNKTDDFLAADMIIGYKFFRERFSSKVELSRPKVINVIYEDGPFKYLNNNWKFIPNDHSSCTVDFFVDFEIRSTALQKVIGAVFNEAVKIMVQSFEKRASIIYSSK